MAKHTRTLRTELPTEVWEAFFEQAAEHNMTIGAWAREVVIKAVAHEFEPVSDEPEFVPLASVEKQQVRAWMIQHSGGTGPGYHKEWRARADDLLRMQGVDLPPLPPDGTDHDALLRWCWAADAHLSPKLSTNRAVLPRREDYMP